MCVMGFSDSETGEVLLKFHLNMKGVNPIEQVLMKYPFYQVLCYFDHLCSILEEITSRQLDKKKETANVDKCPPMEV